MTDGTTLDDVASGVEGPEVLEAKVLLSLAMERGSELRRLELSGNAERKRLELAGSLTKVDDSSSTSVLVEVRVGVTENR